MSLLYFAIAICTFMIPLLFLLFYRVYQARENKHTPSLDGFSTLVAEARKKGKQAGIKKTDISDAILKVRSQVGRVIYPTSFKLMTEKGNDCFKIQMRH
jgi:hypothetical protein